MKSPSFYSRKAAASRELGHWAVADNWARLAAKARKLKRRKLTTTTALRLLPMNLAKPKLTPEQVAKLPGLIPHCYVNASEQPGQFEAERCNRQAATVAFLFEHPDLTAWTYDREAAEMGLDPWREIDGVDRAVDGGQFSVWLVNAPTDRAVPADMEIYVQVRDILKHLDAAPSSAAGAQKGTR